MTGQSYAHRRPLALRILDWTLLVLLSPLILVLWPLVRRHMSDLDEAPRKLILMDPRSPDPTSMDADAYRGLTEESRVGFHALDNARLRAQDS